MNAPTESIEALARNLWGPPNRGMSTRDELRFGANGSKSVKLKDAVWFDHEENEGGTYSDLYFRVHGRRPERTTSLITAAYDYHDAEGRLIYQVVRMVPKTFRQRRPNGTGGFDWNMLGIERIPYRLPELLSSPQTTPVYIAEGEKDVDALRERGLIATTNPGGAGKWLASMSQYLKGRDVVILPDNDKAGEEHARSVAGKLRGVARSVRVLRLPALPDKGDVSDWLAAGGTAEDLERLAAAAPEPQPADTPAPEPRRFNVVNPANLVNVPVKPREWVIDDWLPIGCVTASYGDGGVGKTLLAQQLMTSTAIGAPWCGREVLPCRSFGFFCEDDEEELHRRQEAICAAYGVSIADLEPMRWVSGIGLDNSLITFDREGSELTALFEVIRKTATDHGARLIVLDTAADLFSGNENDRHQVRTFITHLNGLAFDLKAAVLLNAHPSVRGISTGNLDGGNTAWNNSVRSRWTLARPPVEDGTEADDGARILTRKKANYASTGEEIRLQWVNGVLMPQAATRLPGAPERAAADYVFLTLLQRCETDGIRVSQSKNAPNFAPKAFVKRPDRAGYSAKDFEAAMYRLFERKAIRLQEYGRQGSQRIVRVTDPVPEDV